jgi:hypothetical protein
VRIEQTRVAQEVILHAPSPKFPESSRNQDQERKLTIIPPAVYVEYDKRGIAQEYRFGGRSWVC